MTKRLFPLAALAAALAVGLLASHGGPAEASKLDKLYTEGPIDSAIQPSTPVTFGAFAELAKKCAPAVVSIEIEGKGPDFDAGPQGLPFFFGPLGPHDFGVPRDMLKGMGSGFLIRGDGYVLSNNHVVENAKTIHVKLLDGRAFEARLVGRDPATDVSLLKIDAGQEPLPVVPLGNSDALQIGEWVVAIGNPLGLSHTVTAGIVSATHRGDVRPDGRLRYADFIQTDASINPGNSGGPLFNTRGEVVGINTAIRADGQGIGFAIPINMVKTLLPALQADGRVARSWMGIQIQEVTPALATSFGLDKPRGALIASVVRAGPAARAGLKEGDVVTRFDDKAIGKDEDLPWLASTAGVGRTVNVEIYRDGKPRTLSITLEAMPGDGTRVGSRDRDEDGDGGRGRAAEEEAAGVGLTLAPLGVSEREQAGVERGVLVARVERGSPAARAGVERGDVIVQVNAVAAESPKAVAKELFRVGKGEIVRLLLQRGRGRTFIAFTR